LDAHVVADKYFIVPEASAPMRIRAVGLAVGSSQWGCPDRPDADPVLRDDKIPEPESQPGQQHGLKTEDDCSQSIQKVFN
jgi:hypothetical protein